MSATARPDPIRSDEDLTADQLSADSHLDWDDQALGRAVRGVAVQLQDEMGDGALHAVALARGLAAIASERGLEEMTLELDGLERDGEKLGDWRLTLRRDPPA